MICVETFFSHFGAMHCKKLCEAAGLTARLSPVPRRLSSSCGTCLRVETDDPEAVPRTEEAEQLALEEGDDYRILWTCL